MQWKEIVVTRETKMPTQPALPIDDKNILILHGSPFNINLFNTEKHKFEELYREQNDDDNSNFTTSCEGTEIKLIFENSVSAQVSDGHVIFFA